MRRTAVDGGQVLCPRWWDRDRHWINLVYVSGTTSADVAFTRGPMSLGPRSISPLSLCSRSIRTFQHSSI